MEDYDNKENIVDIDADVDDKMPTSFTTTTKKKYFANHTAKTEKDEILDAVYDIADMYTEQFKSASKKDKVLILAILLPLAILLIIGAVGVFIANIGQALQIHKLEVLGWVLMGVGLGGFFLYIVGILIWNRFR